jgi:hypothetical protein
MFSEPEDIVLGPPKLAFASANRTARAVDSSEKRGVNSIDGEHLRDRFPRTRGERWTRDRDRDEEGSRMQSKGQILYDFISQGDDEVTVSIGDRVLIIDDYSSDEWWSVRLLKNGQEGVVPSSYVQITAKIETRTRASPLPASPEIGTGMYSMHPVERYKQDKVRDYSGVQRPRQELSGVAYQDLTRPTPSGEILNQAAQAVEIKKQIEQQRKSRKEYLDNYWARPHEPSPQLQRRTTAEGETVPQVTQGIQSPHLPSSNPAGPTHEKIHEEKSKKTPYTLLRATNVAHEQASSPFYMAYTISQDTTIKTESLQKAKLSAIKDRRICFKSKPSLLERLTNKSYNTSLNATLFDNLQ